MVWGEFSVVGEKGCISFDVLMVVVRVLIDMNVMLLFLFVYVVFLILMIYFLFCIFFVVGWMWFKVDGF